MIPGELDTNTTIQPPGMDGLWFSLFPPLLSLQLVWAGRFISKVVELPRLRLVIIIHGKGSSVSSICAYLEYIAEVSVGFWKSKLQRCKLARRTPHSKDVVAQRSSRRQPGCLLYKHKDTDSANGMNCKWFSFPPVFRAKENIVSLTLSSALWDTE